MNGEENGGLSAQDYAAARDGLLSKVREELAADEHFLAAWVGGSLGRGEADRLSDLDLFVVAADNAAATLCARPWMVGGRTTPERLALFGRFGLPAVIHENHHNAPARGTFTCVMYRRSGLMVDWVLVPPASARRPAESLLLFDKAGVPEALPPGPVRLDQQAEALRERLAFFWMMAAVTAKYAARGDTVNVLKLLNMLYGTLADVEALAAGRTAAYRNSSAAPLVLEAAQQVSEVRRLAGRAEAAAARVSKELPAAAPTEELEIWLRLASDFHFRSNIGRDR